MPSESQTNESHRFEPAPTDPSIAIALIGATEIAARIASRALHAGHRVIIDDISDARCQAISAHLQDVVRAQHRTAPGPQDQSDSARPVFSSSDTLSTIANLSLTQSIESAIRPADFIIDTLPDDLEVKLELFTLFDKFAKPNAIFITAGGIPIDDLASITFCPDRCVAVRLSSPTNDSDATFRLIAGSQTSPQTITASADLFTRACKFRPKQT